MRIFIDEAHKCTALAHTSQVEHHKEGRSGYTWSCTVYIILPQIEDVQCHTQTHIPIKKLAPLTIRSMQQFKVCICSRAPHCMKNSTPKRAGQNPERISQEAIYYGILAWTSSRYQAFEKLLWKPGEDASQKSSWNQMSTPIYHGHQTPWVQFLVV